MYRLELSTQFKKDLKKVKKHPRNKEFTIAVLEILQKDGVDGIPIKMKPHRLMGQYKDFWECHILPDLLIIWFQIESPKIIKLIRIGSHSELFK